MNAGFSSLTYLKSQLLAEALRGGTKYDAAITLLGLGVAATIEKHCNRKFYRTESDTYDHSADCDHLYVPRYPVESVASVKKQSDPTTGFVTVTDQPVNWDAPSGQIYFGGVMGAWFETLRVTYTGGYWWDITEDESDTIPAAATALPSDLKLAWMLQCKELWAKNDALGVNLATRPADQKTTGEIELLPAVVAMIAAYRRFQIS